MMNNFCKQILVFLLFFSSFTLFSQNTYKQKVKLMGSRFDITVIAKDEKTSDTYIKIAIDEIKRIERLISSWDSNSQTTLINKNAGIQPVKVDKELFELKLENNLWDAAQKLKTSAMAKEYFGAEFVNHYAASREWEVREYQKHISQWELERYFEII